MCTTMFNLAAVAATTALLAAPAVAGEEENVRVRTKSFVIASDEEQGSHSFEVTVDNGEIAIRVDGKEVPAHRIKSKDGHIIILDEDGMLYLATATPDALEVHAKTQLLQKVAWTPPTLVGTTLYVRDNDRIVAVDLGKRGLSPLSQIPSREFRR